MHSIDTPGSQDGQFVAGNPETGTPPTRFSADWLNAVQNELLNVIIAAGITPDKADHSQLLAAIQQQAGGSICITGIDGGNFTDSNQQTCLTATPPEPVVPDAENSTIDTVDGGTF